MKALKPFAITAATGWWLGRAIGMVAAVAALAVGPRMVARRAAVRRADQMLVGYATIMELAARGTRSGSAPAASLATAASTHGGPAGAEIAQLLAETPGVPLGAAADRWARRTTTPGKAVVAATIGLVADGAVVAPRAFEAAAVNLRASAAAAAEAAAWASQARASAGLLVLAPAAMGLLALVVDPAATARMFTDPLALVAVSVGVAMEVTGAWWMHRLVRSTSRWMA